MVSNKYFIACGGVEPSEYSQKHIYGLQIGEKGSIQLRIHGLYSHQVSRFPKEAIDLLEIAAYVYAADRIVPHTTNEATCSKQPRDFTFKIPVHRLSLWKKTEVLECLKNVLEFLTGEFYEFEFSNHPAPPSINNYLADSSNVDGTRTPPSKDEPQFQDVLLFSGGIDSLGGAIEQIFQKTKKVVLVSHFAENPQYDRQRRLVQKLMSLVQDQSLAPQHVAIKVNTGKEHKPELQLLSQSFLYGALGAAIASCSKLDKICYSANSISSFNLPLTEDEVGARTVRSTHPEFLQMLGKLLSKVFSRSFEVENHHFWKTKVEVLKDIQESGHGDLCALTCSCERLNSTKGEITHCGSCFQCLERRVSVLSVNLKDSEDPLEKYQSDVLIGEREDEDCGMAFGFFQRVDAIVKMESLEEFCEQYPGIAELNINAHWGVRTTANSIFFLYRQYSKQVNKAFDDFISGNPQLIRSKDYPVKSLLSWLVGRDANPESSGQEEGGITTNIHDNQWTFNDDEHTVSCGEKTCDFGAARIQYYFLKYLHKRVGEQVPYERLKNAVWNGRETLDPTIHQTRKHVVKKLKNAGFKDFEISGWNKYYKFSTDDSEQ